MEQRYLYGGAIAVAGVVLSLIQLVQGIQQTDRPIIFVFETLPFLLVAVTLAYLGYRISGQEQYEQNMPIILAWAIGSTILFVSVASLQLFSQQVTIGTLEQAQYIAINYLTVGAVVGTLVGLYDARSRQKQRDLEHERDRVESFANKAADINNYGRTLNNSGTIDEVSALCVEGMQALLGLSEVAFVLTDGEETEIVDTTILNVSDDALGELARESHDQKETTVVMEESVPAELTERTDGVVSMLVTSHDEFSVVLLALTGEATTFETEDVQLLELLVAHAATAVDRIHNQNITPAE